MDKQIYQLTKQDLKKVRMTKEQIPTELEKFDVENKKKLGKKFGLKKRDFAESLLRGTVEYRHGCGQGRLDKYLGLEYAEKTGDNAYNMGYYEGYGQKVSGWIEDAKKTNPNFQNI